MKLATTLTALLLAAAPACAAPFTIDTTGIWTAASPDPLGNPNTLEGLGTHQIAWGIPAGANKSGYAFVGHSLGVATEPLLLTGLHQLGALVHFNWPIELDPGAITSATLSLSVSINGSAPIAFDLAFQHFETNNDENPCAITGGAPPSGGCRDVVTLPAAAVTRDMLIDGALYRVEIAGFQQNSAFVSQFVTDEAANTSAGLYARFARVAVPEPGAALLLGVGMIGVGVMRRRGRAVQVRP